MCACEFGGDALNRQLPEQQYWTCFSYAVFAVLIRVIVLQPGKFGSKSVRGEASDNRNDRN